MPISIDACDSGNLALSARTNQAVAGVEDHQVQKLQTDTHKWMMAKAAPRKFGERLDLNHSGKVETAPQLDFSMYTREEKMALMTLLEKGLPGEGV